MNVGDYVRTKNKQFQPSQIAKIKNIEKDMVYKGQKCLNLDHNLLNNYEFLIYEEDVIKSSPNIIDLIDVGDYVNGSYVEGFIEKNKFQNKLIITEAGMIDNNDIKSIVTKEMYSSVEYRVEIN